MTLSSGASSNLEELTTERLVLRPITDSVVKAIHDGQRLEYCASGFPEPGDTEIANLLTKVGLPAASDRGYGHRLVVERQTALVIGGAGFFGPPSQGMVEIGYGVVKSHRGRGYATEVVLALCEYAMSQTAVNRIIATADVANPGSVRVLQKSGFTYHSQQGAVATYVLARQ